MDINPTVLNKYGLDLEDVRATLASANTNRPKGEVANPERSWAVSTTDQLLKAEEYRPLIIHYQGGSALRLSDVATVTDSVENIFTGGLANGKPAVLMIVSRQPGANIIDTVDSVLALLPQLAGLGSTRCKTFGGARTPPRRSAPRSVMSKSRC